MGATTGTRLDKIDLMLLNRSGLWPELDLPSTINTVATEVVLLLLLLLMILLSPRSSSLFGFPCPNKVSTAVQSTTVPYHAACARCDASWYCFYTTCHVVCFFSKPVFVSTSVTYFLRTSSLYAEKTTTRTVYCVQYQKGCKTKQQCNEQTTEHHIPGSNTQEYIHIAAHPTTILLLLLTITDSTVDSSLQPWLAQDTHQALTVDMLPPKLPESPSLRHERV